MAEPDALLRSLELVPVATLLLDHSLRVLAGNEEAARLLGCGREQLRGTWGHALAPEVQRRLAALQRDARPDVFDADLALPAGAARAVLVRARRIGTADAALTVVSLVDVTRRQNAEARLATANRRLEVALAGAELGAWQRDLRRDVLEVSPRWRSMLGLPPEPAIVPMAEWDALIHPEDLPPLRVHVAAHLQGRIPRYEVAFRLRHADGRWLPVLSRGEVIERDAEGRPLVMVGTHLDLSAQHAAEAARAASEREARRRLAELEQLYHAAPLGLGQLDRELRFLRINEALADINGFPVEAHIGRSAWDLVPSLREAAEPLLRRVVEQGETVTDVAVTGETAKAPGVPRDWVEQFYPVRDPETQEVTGVGIVCEEVTERKRAERTRELLLRELDHRVKNLFAILGGLVSFSATGAESPQAMRNALLGRIRALAQAHDLVRPAIAGDTRGAPAAALLDLLRTLMAPFQGGDGLPERLCFDGPALPLGPLAAPPLALALHELATNAAKYGALSREGGTVAVDWRAEDAWLRLRWMEFGGPAAAPGGRGFGHRLVTQSASQLGGRAEFHWDAAGLRVELVLPLARLSN